MERLCLIPCGKKKIWDEHPDHGSVQAESAYLSVLHQKCQAYAKMFFSRWAILSAKHGLLLPDDLVPGNYDVSFGTSHPDHISIETMHLQAANKNLLQAEQVVVLGGKKFMKVVPLIFQSTMPEIVYPLADCKGIGFMLQKLDGAIKQGNEIPADHDQG